MAGDSSFDVVSKVDRQEVDNAFNQAEKEIAQRYDFKGVGASIEKSGEAFVMKASSEERVKAVLDVFISKLAKRGISLKALDHGTPQPSGKEYRIPATEAWFRIDGPPGHDIVYWLVSPLPLAPGGNGVPPLPKQKEPPKLLLPRCDDSIFRARPDPRWRLRRLALPIGIDPHARPQHFRSRAGARRAGKR